MNLNENVEIDELVRRVLCKPVSADVEIQLRQQIEAAGSTWGDRTSYVSVRRLSALRYSACVGIAAALLMLTLWTYKATSTLAFADVRIALQAVSSVVGKAHYPNAPQNDELGYLSTDHTTLRAELPGDLVVILRPNGERLTLNEREKIAVLSEGQEPVEDTTVRNMLLELSNLPEQNVRSLGEKEIEGRKLAGFQIPTQLRPGLAKHVETRLWVDPKTNLPVIKEQVPIDPNDPIGQILQVTITYELNKPLNDSLFSMSPPDGYRVVRDMDEFPLPGPIFPKGMDAKSLLIEPKKGIGKAEFGMSLTEVIASIGFPDWIDVLREKADVHEASDAWLLSYQMLGFQIAVSRDDGMETVMCFGELGATPNTGLFDFLMHGESFGAGAMRQFPGKTSRGIGVKSSMAEVKSAYGVPTEVKSNGETKFLTYTNGGVMIFAFDGVNINNMLFIAPSTAK